MVLGKKVLRIFKAKLAIASKHMRNSRKPAPYYAKTNLQNHVVALKNITAFVKKNLLIPNQELIYETGRGYRRFSSTEEQRDIARIYMNKRKKLSPMVGNCIK